jgi:hypothetical protein
VWLRQEGKSSAFVLVPAAFVLTITLWALVELARVNLAESTGLDVKHANGASALALLALAAYLVVVGTRRLRAPLVPART